MFVHVGEGGGGDFGAQFGEPVEQRSGFRQQVEAVDATVIRVGPALDQAVLAEAVDQPGQGDRLHLHQIGEFRLLQPFIAFELGQHRPVPG